LKSNAGKQTLATPPPRSATASAAQMAPLPRRQLQQSTSNSRIVDIRTTGSTGTGKTWSNIDTSSRSPMFLSHD
jgi:hypothetical protein